MCFRFQYSLEGHQFAVFGFVLTNDLRYMVSISTRFVTWDLSTSDLQRDVNPAIEGIMQQLNLSPDNKWAAAYSNNNQTVLLNMLSSEFVVIDNPFNEGEHVTGVFLLNQWSPDITSIYSFRFGHSHSFLTFFHRFSTTETVYT